VIQKIRVEKANEMGVDEISEHQKERGETEHRIASAKRINENNGGRDRLGERWSS